MGFQSISYKAEYCFSEEDRHPFPTYRFTCRQKPTNENRCRIFHVCKEGAELIFVSNNIQGDEEIHTFMQKAVFPSLSDCGLISGGHTVINLADKYACGQAAVHTAKISLDFIQTLQHDFNKQYGFLIQFNDLYAEKEKDSENKMNPFREKMRDPLIVPIQINNLVKQYSEILQREIFINYCFEMTMARRCKRYLLQNVKNNDAINYTTRGDFFVRFHDRNIQLSKNNKPNCAACHAAMLRYVRYNIDNKTITENVRSFIGIFPLCSEKNVLDGSMAAYSLYPNFDLQTYLIFYEDLCY